MTDWQEIGLKRIAAAIEASGPMPLLLLAGEVNISVDTLRNWRAYGLLKCRVLRNLGGYPGLSPQVRWLVIVEGVNLPSY